MWLRTALPADHVVAESRETVKVGVGFVASMTALVLGFITGSAKTTFDAVAADVRRSAGDILALDRALARYGPETGEIRIRLQRAVAAKIDMIWPPDASLKPGNPDLMHPGSIYEAEGIASAIRELEPRDDNQQALRSRALDIAESVLQTRWLPFVGAEPSVYLPLLVALLFWLTIIFVSFGLFAPRNGTVLAVMFICALSAASDLFLILELHAPFDGLIKISAGPLRYAKAHLNQ
jgi:hypothetical protein